MIEAHPIHTLDLHDVQGIVLKAYGRYGFPKARYMLFRVNDGAAGRRFVQGLAPLVTTSAPWGPYGSVTNGTAIPVATTNVAFTYHGLRELGVPRASLQSFPDEFAMGMRGRRDILGDDGPSAPEHWDPVWLQDDQVHILVWINCQDMAAVEKRYNEVIALIPKDGDGKGVVLCPGHRGPEGRQLPYQDASAVYADGQPTAKEHFGYTDGISNPFFKGALQHEGSVVGGGKPTGLPPETRAGWAPLETGEFLLGHKDEASEYPEAPIPSLLAANGTFMVLRKLHQNTASFDRYMETMGSQLPEGKETLAAKFVGRWRNGAPITSFPTEAEAMVFGDRWEKAKREIAKAKLPAERDAAKLRFADLNAKFVAFNYNKDLEGGRCPVGAHVRRANPRGSLEFNHKGAFQTPGAVDNRRRLLRRGLPYGESQVDRRDEGDHGVMFMAINASIRRQFEFVQQQWITYSNDFNLANDRDPIVGNHGATPDGKPDGRMVLEAGPGEARPPFFCSGMPRFVETRGGDYFFIPGLCALRMIGAGTIDPT
jgi:Dyp-type peroxidase family